MRRASRLTPLDRSARCRLISSSQGGQASTYCLSCLACYLQTTPACNDAVRLSARSAAFADLFCRPCMPWPPVASKASDGWRDALSTLLLWRDRSGGPQRLGAVSFDVGQAHQPGKIPEHRHPHHRSRGGRSRRLATPRSPAASKSCASASANTRSPPSGSPQHRFRS
jgi:hypothetical protein